MGKTAAEKTIPEKMVKKSAEAWQEPFRDPMWGLKASESDCVWSVLRALWPRRFPKHGRADAMEQMEIKRAILKITEMTPDYWTLAPGESPDPDPDLDAQMEDYMRDLALPILLEAVALLKRDPDADRGRRERRVSSMTGRIVELWDGEAPGNNFGVDEDERGRPLRWWTYCVPHGSLASHRTLKRAREWLADPIAWCETCQTIHRLEQQKAWGGFHADPGSRERVA